MTTLPGLDARSPEVRHLLDLVSLELQRAAVPAGVPISVRAASPDLAAGLADRLWPEHAVTAAPSRGVAVHLFDLEEGIDPGAFACDRVVLVFRNAWSHKRARHAGWRGLAYPSLEWRVRRSHVLAASYGVMPLTALGGLALAATANAAGRHAVGFHLADRALLAPTTASALRWLCPFGLIHARRRW